MNRQNQQANILDEWQRAEQALREAQVLADSKLYEGATSRAYYAAFHATQAALLTESLQPKSHHGVMYLFVHHFVKTGRIEPRYSQILARAAKYREEADYRHTMVFTAEQTTQTIHEVTDFLQRMQTYLTTTGFQLT